MQLPELLNRNSLFKTLQGINDNNINIKRIKQEIFSRGTSAKLHLSRIMELNDKCITEFSFYENQLDNIKDERIVYSSESLGYLLNEISPLMATLRLLQNLILKLLSYLYKISLPSSINDYFRKPKKYELNSDIHKILEIYWNKTGKQLKYYRDFDQHFGSLTERYFMQIKEYKTIFIEFPDNPESKKPKEITYYKKINAINFLDNSFKEIHEVFENISKINGAKATEHSVGCSMSQLGSLLPASNRTISFLDARYYTQVNNNITIHWEGIGVDQQENGQLSFRKYFLDDENLEKAKKYYCVK